jgi:hypothetical protein
MSRGPTYFDTKGACIYCGATNVELSDEHIVPYSLGGSHVLRKASCSGCANITKKFEQKVARDLWGDARTAFNAPTRRKKERRTHLTMSDPHDPAKELLIPAGKYPAGLVFYKMPQAGLLQGMPETVDISSIWEMVVIDDDKRRQRFLEQHPGKLVIRFRHVPSDFGRLLAKIGYGQVLTTLDPGDFRPICLPYITGEKTNVSYVVGGTFADQVPEPENGYSLRTAAFGSSQRVMLVALIRLYANTHAPAYHVVVGDVAGAENVERVTRKLGMSIEQAITMSKQFPSGPANHWLPQRLTLPLWVPDAAHLGAEIPRGTAGGQTSRDELGSGSATPAHVRATPKGPQ